MKWRVVGIVLLVVFVGVIAYALTRPSPPGEAVGDSAPAFSFTDLSGVTHTLSSYQGHPVFLWWIATWCPHCTQDTQVLAQDYYSRFHAEGITILEIQLYNNLGESGPSLSTFAQDNGYRGQVGWTFGTSDPTATGQYDAQAVTDVYYLLNSQGVILTQGAGAGGAFPSLLTQAQGQ
jgi:thiol-disulfide isomerase/thioredoxin